MEKDKNMSFLQRIEKAKERFGARPRPDPNEEQDRFLSYLDTKAIFLLCLKELKKRITKRIIEINTLYKPKNKGEEDFQADIEAYLSSVRDIDVVEVLGRR